MRWRSATTAFLALLSVRLAVWSSRRSHAHLARRSPPIAAAAGLAAIAGGNAALLVAPAVSWLIPIAVGASGAGIGLSSVASTTQGTAVAGELQGTAAGVLNTAAQLGTALGVAAALLLAVSTEGSDLPLAGTLLGYAAAALAAAVSALLALASIRRERELPLDTSSDVPRVKVPTAVINQLQSSAAFQPRTSAGSHSDPAALAYACRGSALA